jgi:hypothetical protein
MGKTPEESVNKFRDKLAGIKKAQDKLMARIVIDNNDRPKGVLPQTRRLPERKKTTQESIFRD